MIARLLLPAVLLFTVASAARAQEKMSLRQHWEPGKVYHFELKIDMERKGGDAGAGPQGMAISTNIDITVKKEAATQRKLSAVKFTSLRAIQEKDGAVLTFDTTDLANSDPKMRADFERSPLRDFTLVYDEKDEFVEVIHAEGPDGAPPSRGPGEMFAALLKFPLPADPVAVGDTFVVEKPLGESPGAPPVAKVQGRVDSMVERDSRKLAKLVMEGVKDEANPDVNPIPGRGFETSIETLFDLERRSVGNTIMKSKMKPPGQSGIEIMQTFNINLKGVDNAKE